MSRRTASTKGRTAYRVRASLILVCMMGLYACAPSLNWREVHLGRLATLLPCKPDSGSRTVELAGQTVSMDMQGCEAAGALYAISHVQTKDPEQAFALLGALRQASLAKVRMTAVKPMADSGDALSSLDIQVDGQGPGGAPLQARFKWLLAGSEVYQIAAYAEHLGQEQTESLIREARLH